MIKNNKGFMLIEAIITSTIVLTMLITLYTSYNKLYNNYKIKNTYYDLDSIYATKEMINLNLNNNNFTNILNKTTNDKPYSYIIKDNVCLIDDIIFKDCQSLQTLYDVNNMIILKYTKDSFILLKEKETLNQTYYDYLDYLVVYYNLENTSFDYDYIILTETKNGSTFNYAAIRMR